jgi:Arc/MetJ-type ribon-helix-helix transcriptional regulator
MARPQTEHWSVPLPSDFAAELEAAMKVEGFNSKAEFTRAALREKLERTARRRLEAALLEGVESGTADETTEAFFERLRGTLTPRKKRAARRA